MKAMKIEEQVLSREQMAHLVELGVDTSDASMAYYNISREDEPDKWLLGIANDTITTAMLVNGFEEAQPAYTIGDLIEKLPKCIDGNELFVEHGWKYGYRHIYERLYVIDYSHIERLYELFCWVAENHKELIIT